MKRFKNVGGPSRPLTDLPESDSGALFKTGGLSLLFHIVLIIFLIFYLKTGITRSGSPVYRVTITSVSPQNNSNYYPLQELPTPQSAPAKTQKEEKRLKEELKLKEPIKEPKQPRQYQVDEETIKKPIPLPMAETSTSNIDADLEKEQILTPIAALPSEEKNTSKELSSGGGTGTRTGTGTGGSALSGSGEGEGTGEGGSRWGGEGTGPGRRGSGWVSSGEGSGKGKGGSGFGGSGKGPATGRGGSRGGSGAASPRYGENPKPVYPLEARQKGYEGEVLLKVEVLQNGRVGEVQVEKSSGYEILDQSAIAAVKKWRFVPATKGGVNIPCWVNIPFKFQLRDISF
jgi:TonB family protein